ncbi:bifunctional diguanylate cyclase/phosphodiesterase [Actinoplanes sp. TFC3]|uniref:putative bifunctional diguanylate cyclase/phosphodiesterase n=1 Tax=Actinoplanes sp. TFC3 TaxID=1710355 RepID=UPI0008372965|nr:EAL domain-containing protein [Actinoplanes sp. TFC3]
MDAAQLRCSMPGNRRARRARRGAGVAVGAALLVDAGLWLVFPGSFADLHAEFWVLAALALAVDARPYVLANRRASAVVLPSICFTFAIVLAWGYVPALAVQLAGIAISGVRLRHSNRRALSLAAQHVVALAAAALVAGLTGLHIDGAPTWGDAVLTVVAAAAWILARHAAATAIETRTRATGNRLPAAGPRAAKGQPHQRRRLELFATAAFLLLGPVVFAAAQAGLTVVPLVLLALHAVQRMIRSARDSERTDALTGLPNRRALQTTVAERGGALLLLDIDRFRTVNDALGHALGDRLLVEVGQRLAASVPDHDLVVRLGGDEFAVLATRVQGVAAARRVAAHLTDALGTPFALNGLPVDVSASIGIALQPGDSATLLRRAESAMYDAKQRGAQFAVYTGDAEPPAPDLALLADLREALRTGDGGITIYYQPQVAIATGEVVGVEALLRWQHPERGMVGPEELLRVVEKTPIMRRLTSRVLHEVIAQLADWNTAGLPLRASVNVSVRDLHAPGIATEIQDLLHRYEVTPDLLQLEITESALMADPHRVLDTITRLDRAGVAISLDDFGTGYSSLQHVRRMPLSEVKIDRSFVLGMSANRDDAAIVRSVVDLAGSLGLRVVAEGVEDERTWRLLAAYGCHAAQGWFHARPMPAPDLAEWLARYRPLPGALATT